MAKENLQVIVALYDALRRKDPEAMLALSSPEISVYQSEELPWGGSYRGPEGVLGFFGKVSSFLDSSVAVERMLDAGDHVVVVGRTSGTVKPTQKAFDVPLVHLWRVQEGKVVSLTVFLDHPAMLPQVG